MSEQNFKQKSTWVENPEMLGELLGHYPIHHHKAKRWIPIIAGGMTILASIGLIVMLAIKTWDRINIHGRAVILSAFSLPATLYALLFIAGILLILLAILFWHDGIQLFDKGLVHRTARKIKTWDYQDTDRFDSHIAQINFGGSIVSTQVLLIFEDLANNRLVIRNRYDRMPELIESLRALILPNLIKKFRQRLLLGETLVFDRNLQANQNALIINGNALPYDAVTITLENQVVKLIEENNPKQTIFKTKIQHIRNLDLLFSLLENPPEG